MLNRKKRCSATHLIDDYAPTGYLLLSQGLEQAAGLIDPQHSGDGSDDEFCELLVPKQLLDHHNTILPPHGGSAVILLHN